jgi:hypothetical protein
MAATRVKVYVKVNDLSTIPGRENSGYTTRDVTETVFPFRGCRRSK